MCGIYGFLPLNQGAQASTNFEREALKSQRSRGPDSTGRWQSSDGLFVGTLRLLTIGDLNAGQQPKVDSENWMAFNGCIYNFLELQTQFRLHPSPSDTDTLFEFLKRFGDTKLAELNGPFAIAFGRHDNRGRQQAFLMRDRFGKKPLFYRVQDQGLYFSSNLAPLVPLGSLTPDALYVRDFLEKNETDSGNRSPFKEIKQVPPGGLLALRFDSPQEPLTPSHWYSWNERKEVTTPHDQGGFEELFENAVKIRLRSNSPIAISLSGGVDSSAVYSAAMKLSPKSLTPFTISLPQSINDEFDVVDRIVTNFGQRQELIVVSERPTLSWKQLVDEVNESEFPLWSVSGTWSAMFQAMHREGFRIEINGQGGDEVLGGYPAMIDSAIMEALGRGHWKSAIEVTKLREASKVAGVSRNPPLALIPAYLIARSAVKFARNPVSIRAASFARERLTWVSRRSVPINLRAIDRLGMAHSIECRSPLLDKDLVEFLLSAPRDFLIDPREGLKAPLRRYLRTSKISFVADLSAKKGWGGRPESLTRLWREGSDLRENLNRNRALAAQVLGSPALQKLEQFLDLPNIHYQKISWAVRALGVVAFYHSYLSRETQRRPRSLSNF